jgi:hypothetical protein
VLFRHARDLIRDDFVRLTERDIVSLNQTNRVIGLDGNFLNFDIYNPRVVTKFLRHEVCAYIIDYVQRRTQVRVNLVFFDCTLYTFG